MGVLAVGLCFAHHGSSFAAWVCYCESRFCSPWVCRHGFGVLLTVGPFFFFFLLLCGFCSVLMAKIGNKAHFPNNIISRHGFKSIYFTNISSLKDSILGL